MKIGFIGTGVMGTSPISRDCMFSTHQCRVVMSAQKMRR